MAELVSVRQFAKLDGCSHTLVQKAIRDGKLPVSADGTIDAALAGSGWRKANRRGNSGGNTEKVATEVATPRKKAKSAPAEDLDPAELSDLDFIAAVLEGRFVSLGRAEQIKENGLAAKNLLAARKEAGDVIDIEVAQAVLFEQARSFRDAWQNWPTRVAPLIAAKLNVAVEPVLEVLNEHVHQQLDDLGEPEADFADRGEG